MAIDLTKPDGIGGDFGAAGAQQNPAARSNSIRLASQIGMLVLLILVGGYYMVSSGEIPVLVSDSQDEDTQVNDALKNSPPASNLEVAPKTPFPAIEC